MTWGKRGTEQYKRSYRRWSKTSVGKTAIHNATKHRRDKVKKWIDTYKVSKGCVNCGFNKWPECLDFDHKNPNNKLFTISAYLTVSLLRLKNEIQKCQILCANCHRHKTKCEQEVLNAA